MEEGVGESEGGVVYAAGQRRHQLVRDVGGEATALRPVKNRQKPSDSRGHQDTTATSQCSRDSHSATMYQSYNKSLDLWPTTSDNDRPRSSGLFHRSKIGGFDPHVMAVCSGTRPPLLPLTDPVVQLPRRCPCC